MINLIPPEGRRLVRREYIARVCAVWAIILAAAVAGAALMLTPTYVLLMKQSHAGDVLSNDTSLLDAEYAKIQTELGQTQALLAQLRTGASSVSVTEILAHIEDARPDTVVMESTAVSREGAKVTVSARGTATTRAALRQFVDTLKQDAFFSDASVPVSDLARDVDVVFTLTLTLAKTQ